MDIGREDHRDDWEAVTRGHTRGCAVMEAKKRECFMAGVVNFVRCCWDFK